MAGKKVVIDARKVGDGGIGVYLDNLVAGLKQLRSFGELDASLCLLVPPVSRLCADSINTIESWSSFADCVEDDCPKYSISEYLLLAKKHSSLLREATIYHTPHITLPYMMPCPTVATIHDALLLTYSANRFKKVVAQKLICSTIKRASAVITVSKQSKMQLEGFFPGVGSLPIQVVNNAVSSRYSGSLINSGSLVADACDSTIPKRILWVGNEKPHKGLGLFLDSLACIQKDMLVQATIVCPALSDNYRRQVAALGVSVCHGVSDQKLHELYQSSDVVVMSSYDEGCGLPAVEACALGTAVATTPLPSVEEMCGDVPYYSSGFSASSLAEAISEALSGIGSKYQAERLARGTRIADSYCPYIQSRKTVEVYDLVLVKHAASSFLLNSGSSSKSDLLQKRSV